MRQEIQDRGRGFLKSVSFRNRLGPRIEDKSLEKKYKSNTFERFWFKTLFFSDFITKLQ